MKNFKKIIFVFVIIILVLNIKPVIRYFVPIKYSSEIVKYSKEYKLDPYLVAAVIKAESSFDKNAKSGKNAYGLMQITYETAEWCAKQMGIQNLSVQMLYDPEFNIKMGSFYLSYLSSRLDGNTDLMLAAYNGGIGNVQKWLKDSSHSTDGKNLYYIPFKETDKYVKKVKVNYKIFEYLYKNK